MRGQRYAYPVGQDGPVPAADATVEPAPYATERTPPYTRQTLSLMGVAALPWIPVATGAWLGGKTDLEHGKMWGALGGFALSFLTIRHFAKKMAGAIT